MGIYKRAGNFGIIDTPVGLATFSAGNGLGKTSTYNFNQPASWHEEKMQVGDFLILPLGYNNDMPNELQQLLDEFYPGEGILGKIQGLQWGEGPRLYEEVYTKEGDMTRRWLKDEEVMAWLKSWDYETQILKCHTDLVHGFGFFYKAYRNLGYRIGKTPRIAGMEHVQVSKCRLEYPGENSDMPKRIIVGDFPYPRVDKLAAYPIFNKQTPFASAVSMGYSNIYSFCKSFYSTPRFYGAYSWIRLVNSIAPLLMAYNANASAISLHIESPQEYWDRAEAKLMEDCVIKGVPYKNKMLEDFKDKAFEEFSAGITGTQNVGKFLHTTNIFSDKADDFTGWKVTPIDKKIKDYIDAQILITKQAETAATSGFGLHPSLSNLIVDGKMASGSEMLYALKSYITTETAIPEMILFAPFNAVIEANFPQKNIKLGFFRKVVMKEDQVSPKDRILNNV